MSDDLRDYEITPEDLGCMGEQEVDPGVVEEAVGSGETNQPISPCFEHIPFENKKKYRKLYDSFDEKDMSFEDFCIEMFAMTSPKMMQQELSGMLDMREGRGRTMLANKQAIERSMN